MEWHMGAGLLPQAGEHITVRFMTGLVVHWDMAGCRGGQPDAMGKRRSAVTRAWGGLHMHRVPLSGATKWRFENEKRKLAVFFCECTPAQVYGD